MSKKLSKNYVVGFLESDGSFQTAGFGYQMSIKEAKETALEWMADIDDEDEFEDNYIFELVPVLKIKVTPPQKVEKKISWVNVESR